MDALKASALEEEGSLFDPSGNSGNVADTEDNTCSEVNESSSDPSASRSEQTDSTSLSNGLHALGLAETDTGRDANDSLDEPTKILLLTEMFPTASGYDIKYVLKKCNNSWDHALNELLNLAFFNDGEQGHTRERPSSKGIDAFSEDNGVYRGRKKKNRKKQRLTDNIVNEERSTSSPGSPRASTWEQGKKDVDFIASRTKASSATISSIYHRNGASVPATIIALVEIPGRISGSTTPVSDDDPIIALHVHELSKDFPSILPTHVKGLIRLTHPSTAAAHELAKAMTSGPGGRGGLQVIPRYAPLNLSDDEDLRKRAVATRSETTGNDAYNHSDYHALAASHHNSAQQSFSQASAAYRRGRSDHLMGAAAGYYSQVGRDHAARRSEATAGAADTLVASQSTANQLDLHGVSVKDAVRIARAKTDQWDKSANRRVMGLDGRTRNDDALGGTFTIVTGLGRHSEGGRGKLGPAVGKMLLSEGWYVSFGEGMLTVTGRKR